MIKMIKFTILLINKSGDIVRNIKTKETSAFKAVELLLYDFDDELYINSGVKSNWLKEFIISDINDNYVYTAIVYKQPNQ